MYVCEETSIILFKTPCLMEKTNSIETEHDLENDIYCVRVNVILGITFCLLLKDPV